MNQPPQICFALVVLPLVLLIGGCTAKVSKALQITSAGSSEYVIFHDPEASESVRLAAKELQLGLREATGVTLPIVTSPGSKSIALGDNTLSREAGIKPQELPLENCRIFSNGDHLIISGHDSPDPAAVALTIPLAKVFGFNESRGTLLGVFTFLQDEIGLRWLMPGEVGLDAPDRSAGLTISAQDRQTGPFFPSRSLLVGAGVNGMARPEMMEWFRRMRLGGSIYPQAAHSFDDFPGEDVLQKHPEYMALQADGTRQPPFRRMKGAYPHHKYDLTNPGLIKAFVESVLHHHAANPGQDVVSISPSDGGGWDQGKASLALTETAPSKKYGDFGGRGSSVTPMVLSFYNAVARGIKEVDPKLMVGGFIYYDYIYPPSEGNIKVEDNVYLELAMNTGYGFKFFQPQRAEQFRLLTSEWSKYAPKLGWYDYSVWMRNMIGAPLPASLEILNLLSSSLSGGSFIKVIFVGNENFGTSAATNYLLCQLMWNPKVDLQEVYNDFMVRAYGRAARPLQKIYSAVEEKLKSYILSKNYPDHELWYDSVKFIYEPLLPGIEAWYLEALDMELTPRQRQRVEMFGDNLKMLHFNMRNAGLVANPTSSKLYLSDSDYAKFLAEKQSGFSVVNLEAYKQGRQRSGPIQTELWGPDRRSLDVPSTGSEETAVIDGQATESFWKMAAVADRFRLMGNKDHPVRETSLHIVAHGDSLLVSGRALAPSSDADQPNGQPAKNEEDLNHDYVTIYLANLARHPSNYWNVTIGAGGKITEEYGGKETQTLNLQVATRRTSEGWEFELKIPLLALGVDRKTVTKLEVNAVRVSDRDASDRSTWCQVEIRPEERKAFGTWNFPPE